MHDLGDACSPLSVWDVWGCFLGDSDSLQAQAVYSGSAGSLPTACLRPTLAEGSFSVLRLCGCHSAPMQCLRRGHCLPLAVCCSLHPCLWAQHPSL